VAVDVYARRWFTYLAYTRYWVRPLTRRVAPERLYGWTERYVHALWPVVRLLGRVPGGARIAGALLVADNGREYGLSDELRREWAVLDTFDTLHPAYDIPQPLSTVRRWLAEAGLEEVEAHHGWNGVEARGRRPKRAGAPAAPAPGGVAAHGAHGARGGEPLRVLVVGEEHVRAKAARHYAALAGHGVRAHVYADDRSGITREVTEKYPLPVRYAPVPTGRRRAIPAYLAGFRRYFHEVRPQVLEVNTAINFALILPMMLYARAHGVPCVTVCRGELYPPAFYGMSRLARALFVRALRASNLILYKEPYMEAMLQRYAPGVPLLFWTNAIPVGGEPSYERDAGDHVLFMNFFWRRRNLELIIRAAPHVRRAVPGVRFHLVGSTGHMADRGRFYADLFEYEKELRALIDQVGAGEYVQIEPFTVDVGPHLSRAKVYLFPSDHVFCNYGLLEAMERGVPPVVSADRDPDALRIVTDGVSGRVVPLDAEPLAAAIVELLQNEEKRRALGRGARARVLEAFDLSHATAELAAAYGALAVARSAGGHRAGSAAVAAAAAATEG
jgi:glycosyltransferase involved in cell wall biosynthesis